VKTSVLVRRRLYGSAAVIAPVFSPASLFALSEPGIWLDPSDLTTMFTDTAGTTQAAVGDAVALVLDKSQGLVLGPELVTNGTFDGSATGWTLANGAAYNNDAVDLNVANGVNVTLSQTLPTPVVGRSYRITYTISNSTTGILRAQYGGANTGFVGGNGTVSRIVVATSTVATLNFNNGANTYVGTIDNISVKELPGFHATQSTTTARPILARIPEGGRRNLLTRTEEINNSVWVPFAGTKSGTDLFIPTTGNGYHTIRQDLTASIGDTVSFEVKPEGYNFLGVRGVSTSVSTGQFSRFDISQGLVLSSGSNFSNETIEAVGDGWFRVTLRYEAAGVRVEFMPLPTNSIAEYAGDGTSGIRIRKAQFELGSTATAYQRVGSTYDVTEAGKADLYHLVFDGTDDWLVTPTITPGTDKVQVFAGVRKLSDAAIGQIVELSADPNANIGSFWLLSRTVVGNYSFASRGQAGSISNAASPTNYPAPITNTLTGIGDISGDNATLRVNGTQVAQGSGDQGTGNFLAYPLYIGRRGGTSLPFNGHLYSLIVRFGANLDAGTIESTEGYVAGKTGINLPNILSSTIFARDDTAVLDRFEATIERRA
jgi:hypothetical protein